MTMKALIAFTGISIGSIASADNLSVRYGQGSCTYSTNTDTGRSMEFYGDVDTGTNEATIGFRYVIEFQKPTSQNNCSSIQSIATQRMQLDLEEQRLELELLRARLAAAENDEPTTTTRLDSDW